MSYKSITKLKVLEYDNYTTKDGRVVEQIILGNPEKFLRYNFRLPKGMPKPKVGDMVYTSIELKEFKGRQYPVITEIVK